MIVVADTGPIVHLHWVGASSWALPPESILVVEEVWVEIERHAPEALRDARLVRAELGIRVIGSLGLVAQAVDEGRIAMEAAVETLEALPTRGKLHVAPELIARAIARLRGG